MGAVSPAVVFADNDTDLTDEAVIEACSTTLGS
jgi:hypothetical protein